MPKHLIVLMADQLRVDLLGEHTPHINSLIADSTYFERAYCASPLCVPARGSFFTGLTPNRTGCLINPWRDSDAAHGYVRSGTPHLYGLLENKWDSWHIGKQHFLTADGAETEDSKTHWVGTDKHYGAFLREKGQPAPGGPRFQSIMPEMQGGRLSHQVRYSIPTTGCYEPGYEYFFDGYFTHQALEAIQKRDKAKPFALNLMFLAPHPPLDIPEPWYSLVKDIELPQNVGQWSEGQSPLQLYNLPGYLGSRYSREDWREVWRVYAGLVALLDHSIGLVIQSLKDEGLYDDSVILFTADHGEMLGSHCLWQKMCMYEESTRVPFSLKLPQNKYAGTRSNQLISHLDVLPTLCDLLELEKPNKLDGTSLLPHLTSGDALERNEIFIQFDGNGALGNFQRCILRNEYKLIVDIFKDEVFFELYNVINDVQETHNLAWQHPDLVENLWRSLQQEMQAGGDHLSLPTNAYQLFLQERNAPIISKT